MLRVVLECKLNDNTVNERFRYQCSIDVINTTKTKSNLVFSLLGSTDFESLDDEYTLETSYL